MEDSMDVKMTWAEGLESKDKAAQNEALDREVERYSKWLEVLPDERARGKLSNPEKALIKTYLVQKLSGKIDEVA
jgi:hypothetical protein